MVVRDFGFAIFLIVLLGAKPQANAEPTSTFRIPLRFWYGKNYSKDLEILNRHANAVSKEASQCMSRAFSSAGFSQYKVEVYPEFVGSMSSPLDKIWSNTSPTPRNSKGKYMNPPARKSRYFQVIASSNVGRSNAQFFDDEYTGKRSFELYEEYMDRLCALEEIQMLLKDLKKNITRKQIYRDLLGLHLFPILSDPLERRLMQDQEFHSFLEVRKRKLEDELTHVGHEYNSLPISKEMGRDIRMKLFVSRTGFARTLAHELFHAWGGLADRYLESCTTIVTEPGYEGGNIMAEDGCNLLPHQAKALIQYLEGGPLEAFDNSSTPPPDSETSTSAP